MASTKSLTLLDLQQVSEQNPDDPGKAAAALLEAVEQGRLTNVADTAVALTIAAGLTSRAGDLPAALALSDRAVDASRVHQTVEWGPRVFRAGPAALGSGGRGDDGPGGRASDADRSVEAVTVITGVLADNGHADLAQQWLTSAVETMVERQQTVSGIHTDGTELTFTLLSVRQQLRHELGLPADAHDDLANSVEDEPVEVESDEHVATFCPRGEYERLLERWPTLREEFGETWDDHRAVVERRLVRFRESEVARTGVVAISVDGLVEFAELIGVDPGLPEIRLDYLNYTAEYGQVTAWPPRRNDACWCGSGVKYKKCCLPRSRG